MNTLTLVEHISSRPGRNDKQQLLDNQRQNEELKRAFYLALNPYIQFYIKKIPKYTPTEVSTTLTDFMDTMESRFATREVTGNAAINTLSELLSTMSLDDAEIAARIIRGDLRCGASTSTVNKTWSGLIPTYPCLLAKPYNDKTIQSITYPAYSQIKADGMRVNIFFNFTASMQSVNIKLCGRSGRVIDLLGCLDDHLMDIGLATKEDSVFDGELVVVDDNGDLLPRKKGNGILNKAIKGTISKEEAMRVRIRVWDIIPYQSFINKQCDTPYHVRYSRIKKLVDTHPSDRYEMIRTKKVDSFREANDHYQWAIMLGEEGTILKNLSHIWEDKRSKHLVKFKAELDCDLEVIGWNQGAVGTKLAGKLGSLECASSDRKVVVNISGFSDKLREEIYCNIQDWIGRIITIMYNERIDSNSNSADSLFLPRFMELREDKSTADHSINIK